MSRIEGSRGVPGGEGHIPKTKIGDAPRHLVAQAEEVNATKVIRGLGEASKKLQGRKFSKHPTTGTVKKTEALVKSMRGIMRTIRNPKRS